MAESLAVFCVLCFVTAFTMSLLLTIPSKRFAVKRGLISHPKDDRFHTKAIPMGGGIAIFFTIFILCMSAVVFIKLLVYDGTTSLFGRDFELYIEGFADRLNELLIILGCAAVLFVLGLWDDFKISSLYTNLSSNSPRHLLSRISRMFGWNFSSITKFTPPC